MSRSKRETQVAAAGVTIVVWLGIGTVMFRILEDWTWIQSLYFSVVTLSTIGYGDLHPTTDIARLATVIYIVFGVVTVLAAFTIIGTAKLEKRTKKISNRRDQGEDS